MRHQVAGFKLGRKTAHRRADRRNLTVSLFTHGQITTTLPKAKSVKPFAEKMITMAKRGDLAARRRVIAELGNPIMVRNDDDPDVTRNKYGEVRSGPRVVKRLFDDIATTFADRDGGYTRIVKLASHRVGDGSDLCVLQLVGREESGPQVSGKYSRRRTQANKRMNVAAALRRADPATDSTESASEPEAADADDAAPDAEAKDDKVT